MLNFHLIHRPNQPHSLGLILHPAVTFLDELEEKWEKQKVNMIWEALTKYRGPGRIVLLCYRSLFLIIYLGLVWDSVLCRTEGEVCVRGQSWKPGNIQRISHECRFWGAALGWGCLNMGRVGKVKGLWNWKQNHMGDETWPDLRPGIRFEREIWWLLSPLKTRPLWC